MKKKGFTLIELLAVIVILAVIALIATPAVLNIIEDSKRSAAEDSARVIAKSAETHYVSNVTLQGEEVGVIDLTKDTLEYKGEKPSKGYVEFDTKGNAYLKMYMNGYCVESDYDNTVTSEKTDSEECNVPSLESIEPFEDGEAVYFNPKGNATCIDGEEGCMRWYAFLDTAEATTVNLLLDHNITDVAWNSDESGTTPDTILSYLNNYAETEEWTVKTRLLRGAEITEIAKKYGETVDDYGTLADAWRADGGDSYCVATGTNTSYNGRTNGPHKLGWLYDNLYNCISMGCNIQSTTSFGYWVEEYAADGFAWWFGRAGYLQEARVTNNYSLRPVIEVSKFKFAN